MKTAEYVSRKVMDRYHDRMTVKIVRLHARIQHLESVVQVLVDDVQQRRADNLAGQQDEDGT